MLENTAKETTETGAITPTESQGANQTVSPPVETTGTGETQAKSPANTPATPVEPPFHEHPRFKQVTSQNQQLKKAIEQAQREAAELKAKFEGFTSAKSQGQQMSPDDAQALEKLMDMMSQHPKFAERFGQSGQLKQELEQLRMSQLNEKFDGEIGSIKEMATKYGLDPQEVEFELMQQFESNGLYAKRDYQPGMVKAAFRDLYFDKIAEMKEREVNRKLIEETNKKKSANVESIGNAGAPEGGLRKDESIREFISRRTRESGGMTF